MNIDFIFDEDYLSNLLFRKNNLLKNTSFVDNPQLFKRLSREIVIISDTLNNLLKENERKRIKRDLINAKNRNSKNKKF